MEWSPNYGVRLSSPIRLSIDWGCGNCWMEKFWWLSPPIFLPGASAHCRRKCLNSLHTSFGIEQHSPAIANSPRDPCQGLCAVCCCYKIHISKINISWVWSTLVYRREYLPLPMGFASYIRIIHRRVFAKHDWGICICPWNVWRVQGFGVV